MLYTDNKLYRIVYNLMALYSSIIHRNRIFNLSNYPNKYVTGPYKKN